MPLLATIVGLSPALQAQDGSGRAAGSLELAGFEDHRVSIGHMEGGVLRVTLEARAVEWRPWGEAGPGIRAHAFSADGAPPRVPGPLLRVSAGTPVRITLRNTFDHPLVVRGLRDLASPSAGAPPVADSVVVAPGGSEEVRFTPRAPGTFVYPGNVLDPDRPAGPGGGLGGGPNRPFVGVMIVDPEGTAPPPGERIFILNHWADPSRPASFLPATRFFVNGRSWPETERLEYTQGDTVRWRVINFTGRPHPMHLHGFFFRVDARGDLRTEDVYAPEDRRMAVTEVLRPAESMRVTWVPDEPGNWIFHCHFMRHMSRLQNAPLEGPVASRPDHELAAGGEEAMGGLVLGITVRPGPGWSPASDAPRRKLRLHIGRRPGVFDDAAGYGFVLQEGPEPPAADSVRFPGSPIVLTRGEPSEITVLNRADVPLGVHWHGLELESWADGVPGWSGTPGRVSPAIPPGDSFAVRMTPPRAGTFMYHVHSEPGHQLARGLYGPFLVLEPGEAWDRDRDRLFLLGSLGTGDDPPPAVNGALEPGPLELRAGESHRLRFMHISPDDDKRVQLLAGDEPVEWRIVAKDGADLPLHRVHGQPAELAIFVGETYDVRWTPEAPGDFVLRVTTTFDRGAPAFPRDAPPPHVAEIPVRVR
jgi:FtsP/CotA-like multicopper oxidase with cupredoxin domain